MRIKNNYLVKLTLILLLLSATTGYAQGPGAADEPALDREITVRVGQEVFIKGEKLRVAFTSVAEDSRCPRGVECVWAGNGKIILEVKRKGKKSALLSLNTTVQPTEAEYRQFRIKLIRLNPDPVYGVPMKAADYEATLVVSKQ